jgi:hypothetical protein
MRKRIIVIGGVAVFVALGTGAAAAAVSAVTAGPAGLSTQVVYLAKSNVPTGVYVIVRCPAAKPYVLGGGYVVGPGMGTVMKMSFPVGGNPNGWEVGGYGPGGAKYSVTAYAICSK